jgi:hypothetical protein
MFPRCWILLSRLLRVQAVLGMVTLGSLAAAQDAGVAHVSPFAQTSEAHSLSANPLYPADTVYVPLPFNSEQFLEGWTEYDANTCQDISPGSYTAPTPPMFGKLRYDVENFTDQQPPCAGVVFPYAVAHYTWTSKKTTAPQDFFSLQWTTPDGLFVENSDWLAELLPQSETTAFKGWANSIGFPTVGQWQQSMKLSTVPYAGVTVQESDPGGGGPDTCWFPGSMYPPQTKISGGTWTVMAKNIWGYDYVGWTPAPVTYYRTQGRAPCGTTFPQQMQIQFATGDTTFYNYATVNTLGANIGTKTVTSIRAGKSATKRWP